MNNLQNDGWELSDLKYIELTDNEAETYRLQNGDILFNRTNSKELVGKCEVFKEKGDWVFASYLVRIRIDESIASPDFVSIFLNTPSGRIQIDRVSRQIIGMTNINAEEIQDLVIPLAPLDKQYALVADMQAARKAREQKLKEADAILDSIDRYVLEELGIEIPAIEEKQYFAVYANEVVGRRIDPFYYQNHYEVVQNLLSHSSNVKRLDELLQTIESGSRPKGGVANIQSGVLSFGGEHINNQCEVEINTPKYIPHEFHNSHKKTATQLNDLLLVKDGATTGKIGIVSSKAHIGQNINEHLFLLRTRDNVNPIYLLNYLHSRLGRLQIQREITGGTVTGITRDVVKRLRIITPDLKKQSEIANHITEIRNRAKHLQQEADAIVKAAKREVERILLGGTSG